MTPRKFRTPHNSIDGLEENQQGPGSIRAKLQSASKEKLIELIERLAADSEKLFSLDEVIFNRADDSGGSIGSELREACVLWLDAAAATRAANAGGATDW